MPCKRVGSRVEWAYSPTIFLLHLKISSLTVPRWAGTPPLRKPQNSENLLWTRRLAACLMSERSGGDAASTMNSKAHFRGHPIAPLTLQQLLAIGRSHHQAGRIADAEAIYRQVLAHDPNHSEALGLLGVAALTTGRLDIATAFLRRAVAAAPASASIQCNLGECLRRQGKFPEAAACFSEAIRLDPSLAVAHNNLGILLSDSDAITEAIAAFRAAININPGYAEAHANLANVLRETGRLDEALSECARSIDLMPNLALNHNNLAVTLVAAGRLSDGLVAYRRAIQLNPHYAEAWSNLANALMALGSGDDAVSAARRAIELEPATVQFHWNYAAILLRTGDFAAGWREYEWRWKQQSRFPRPKPRFQPPRFAMPPWDGTPLRGKTILLHAEQGFGDSIQFSRYAPLVANLGGRVILEAHPELCRLFSTLPGVQQIIARGEPLPRFDAHCPLMSLPLAFGTLLETVPGAVPYLFADPKAVEEWNHKVGPHDNRPRIGLCWAGSPTHHDDRNRSISLRQLSALAAPHVTFHALQKNVPTDAFSNLPQAFAVVDHRSELGDFADTAALIANLDLVITVDTSVAHLAGALGKPTWVLLPTNPDWRWLTDRPDSPWYPTMRLFRQQSPGDWETVLRRVKAALDEFR